MRPVALGVALANALEQRAILEVFQPCVGLVAKPLFLIFQPPHHRSVQRGDHRVRHDGDLVECLTQLGAQGVN